MPHASQFEAPTQLQLLRLASKSLARSAPMLFLAFGFVALLGWEAKARACALTVGALGVAMAIWRVRISQRFSVYEFLDEQDIAHAARELEGHAVLTGLIWVVTTVGIYPDLQGTEKMLYAVLVCGSVGVAAFFMPLVGRAFLILTVAQMGALIGVSLFSASSRSLPMAVMAIIYGCSMHLGAQTFSRMTTHSIRRGLELDAANSALQEALQSAAAANAAKSIFLANMSHEIRTPLTAVIGFSEDLLDVDRTMEERIEAAHTIHRAGKHLLDVINGILDLSKIEAERLDVEHMAVPLLPLIEEVAALARLQASGKGLIFDVRHVYPIPRTVHIDPLRVRQILLNLIGNAIKFTDSGSVTVSASYVADEGRLIISVSDTGIGITDDQLARLFQPFGQADSSVSRRFGGTGLGLVLSRKLAELLGGTLDVRSTPGTGSCFSLTLPTGAVEALLDRPETEPRLPTHVQPDDRGARVCGGILLAEDNLDNQRLIARHLQRLGATLEVVDNGERAVAAALARHHDLVLMDMQMPVMDGLSAVRILRAQGYRGPIVALTANATRDDMQACIDAGCDAFLTKPVERASFDQAVRRFLSPATLGAAPALQEPLFASDDAPDDPAFEAKLYQLSCQLLGLGLKIKAAAHDADVQAIRRIGEELRTAGTQLGCGAATRLGGQLAFAAAAQDLPAVWKLIGRLHELVERVDSAGRRPTVASGPADDASAIVSELLAEGPDMADLVDYFLTRIPDYVERMKEAVGCMDFERIGHRAHDLKSVGGGYGYPVLLELGEEIEAAVASRDPDRIVGLADRFERLARRIVAGAERTSADGHPAGDSGTSQHEGPMPVAATV